MTDDFEDRLRENLGQAVPPPPEGVDRAGGARAYAGRVRRTRAALAVGAVAAAAAGVLTVPMLVAPSHDTADPSVAGPTPTSALPMPPLAHPYVCGSRPVLHDEALKGSAIPAGAVLARLCPAQAGRWSPPAEPLVTDVSGLVTKLNALPRVPVILSCPSLLPALAFILTFQYSDGHTTRAVGSTTGCDDVVTGSIHRGGALRLVQEYLSLLHNQRARYAPPPKPTARLRCGPFFSQRDTILVDGRPAGLVQAVACSYPFLGSSSALRSGTLSVQQVHQLNADLAAHATRQPASGPATRLCQAQRGGVGILLIAAVNAWGDRIDLTGECSIFSFTDRNGTWYWTPTPQTQAILNSVQHPVAHPTGRISGRLEAVGGPPPVDGHAALPRPLAGSVTLDGRGGTQTIVVDHTGRFSTALPPGRYRVTGHSPAYGGGRYPCQGEHQVVTVGAGRTTHDDVLCQEP